MLDSIPALTVLLETFRPCFSGPSCQPPVSALPVFSEVPVG